MNTDQTKFQLIVACVLVATIVSAALAQKKLNLDGRNVATPDVVYTLVDATGAPIAGAQVEMMFSPDPARRPDGAAQALPGPRVSPSDDQGRFAVSTMGGRVPNGTARVTAAEYGIAEAPLYSVRKDVLIVPLIRTGSEAAGRAARGVVVDPDGKPIAGARVTCDTVRTPGEGLIQATRAGPSDAITDDAGRFRVYVNDDSRRAGVEHGAMVPPGSRYSVWIDAPGDASLFPYAGGVMNDADTTIRLQRATRHHTFKVERVGGGYVDATSDEAKSIGINYRADDSDGAGRVGLRHRYFGGGMLLDGVYEFAGMNVRYEPLKVTADSPEELIVKLPPPITYEGKVVNGIDGKPCAGAFVLAMHAGSGGNLALIDRGAWANLHALGRYPSTREPTVVPFTSQFGINAIVRTDDEGKYRIDWNPGDEHIYAMIAVDENRLPWFRSVNERKPDANRHIAVEDIPLFPAARVMVRPIFAPAVGTGRALSVMPQWVIDDANQPDWYPKLKAATGGSQSNEPCYRVFLKPNIAQCIFVPADVTMKMRFETPYNDEWTAADMSGKEIHLREGETMDLGELTFAPSLKVEVHVVDAKGNPVEGAPVRRISGKTGTVAHNADKNGVAQFYVHPNTEGEFRVDGKEKHAVKYKIGETVDAGTDLTIRLAEER